MCNFDKNQQSATLRRMPLITYFQSFSLLFLLVFSARTLAQDSPANAPAATPLSKVTSPASLAKKSAGSIVSSKPEWQDLTPLQQISLKPLAANWNTLEEAQKRKWIAVAANFSALTQTEQTKMHNRMTEWVSLSYQQRAQARLNFAKTKQLTPTEKTTSWQAYQSLSPEEKQKLTLAPKPKLAGAAISPKPVSPQKLATVPVTAPTPTQPSKTHTSHQEVNRVTLLPHSKVPAEPAASQINK